MWPLLACFPNIRILLLAQLYLLSTVSKKYHWYISYDTPVNRIFMTWESQCFKDDILLYMINDLCLLM